ncbi:MULTISPECIES: MFS transporter [Sorangium]|uniref:Membrane protein n=1 Tax=Sorangium cellulosum TaxID=56 RepID=A0A4P2QVR9_SORCE|nr:MULTISPECIES: MFS transporter [Sorangium]AUX34268.1 membrane protein [Sorangium cellulosum]WCQ93586.1 Riboflavin transporter RfnT [Sorangium sp. Soce836]
MTRRALAAAPAASVNTAVLLLCQVVGIAGVVSIQFVGSLVGERLARDMRLATAPVAALVLSSALGTWPASQLMRRFGRRPCFIAAALLSAGCLALAARAVERSDFALFCTAVLGVGLHGAFVQQYRFAILEGQPSGRAPRLLTMIQLASAAGIVPGISLFGLLEGRTSSYMPYTLLILAALQAISALSFAAYRPQEALAAGASAAPDARARALYWPMVAMGAGAFLVMSLIMVPTPLQMCGVEQRSVKEASWVIEVHLLSMYLPSLSVGALLQRMSIAALQGVGLAFLLVGFMISWVPGFEGHLVGLSLVGIGWCYVFVTATTLVARSRSGAERFRAQGVNDLCVFAGSGAASLSSGALLSALGWSGLLHLGVVLVVSLMALAWNVHRA